MTRLLHHRHFCQRLPVMMHLIYTQHVASAQVVTCGAPHAAARTLRGQVTRDSVTDTARGNACSHAHHTPSLVRNGAGQPHNRHRGTGLPALGGARFRAKTAPLGAAPHWGGRAATQRLTFLQITFAMSMQVLVAGENGHELAGRPERAEHGDHDKVDEVPERRVHLHH